MNDYHPIAPVAERPPQAAPTDAHKADIQRLFGIALIKAGSDCCDSCKALRRIVDLMYPNLDAALEVKYAPDAATPAG